jgi:hypothetical protein
LEDAGAMTLGRVGIIGGHSRTQWLEARTPMTVGAKVGEEPSSTYMLL